MDSKCRAMYLSKSRGNFMAVVDISNAKKDMITAEDLLSPAGNVLLPKDTVLTANIIKKLKSEDILTLSIQDAGQHDDEKASLLLADDMEAVERRFSDVRDNTIMEEILGAVKEYLSEKGAGNGK
jgi:hypothetical protein